MKISYGKKFINVWEDIVKLAEEIPTFGLKQLGKTQILTRQTDLVVDLGLIGDDAIEFMDKYASAFNVQFGDYKFSLYFEPEQLWILPTFRKTKKKNSITLGMLELAARVGVWNSDFLENARLKNDYEMFNATEIDLPE